MTSGTLEFQTALAELRELNRLVGDRFFYGGQTFRALEHYTAIPANSRSRTDHNNIACTMARMAEKIGYPQLHETAIEYYLLALKFSPESSLSDEKIEERIRFSQQRLRESIQNTSNN